MNSLSLSDLSPSLGVESKIGILGINSNDYPTIADLMKDQKVTNDKSSTVHFRRDLDSLG